MINRKNILLNSDNLVKSSSNVWWQYLRVNRMSLEWTINDTNETYTSSGGYGDSCITQRSFESDNDLLISIGWYDGFAIRRLNDDGTLSDVFGDGAPIAGYSYYNNLTLDRTNHVAYFGNYNYNGIATYDYSGCLPTGTTVTKSGFTATYDRCGGTYMNGIYIVGDYLYLQPYEASTSVCRRYNVSTQSQDDLTVTNRVYNGRYGEVWYDEDNNRVYMINRTDGGIWVITNPDRASDDTTNPAKCYAINIYGTVSSNDIYSPSVSVDKDDSNHLWVAGYYGRYLEIDITNIINETSTVPTILSKNNIWYNKSNNFVPIAFGGQSSMRSHLTLKSDILIIRPERSFNSSFGWLDKDDMLPVITSYVYDYDKDGVLKRTYVSTDQLKFDYAPFPIRMQSSGGTYYWIVGGYGGDGYKFRTYADSYSGLTLHTSGYITFGDFQLDSNQKIRTVKIENLKDFVHEPTNCSFDVKVSNNSGTDWEIYDWSSEEEHAFTSIGNTLQVKFELTGYNGISAPYIFTTDTSNPMISFSDEADLSTAFSKNNIYKINGAQT